MSPRWCDQITKVIAPRSARRHPHRTLLGRSDRYLRYPTPYREHRKKSTLRRRSTSRPGGSSSSHVPVGGRSPEAIVLTVRIKWTRPVRGRSKGLQRFEGIASASAPIRSGKQVIAIAIGINSFLERRKFPGIEGRKRDVDMMDDDADDEDADEEVEE